MLSFRWAATRGWFFWGLLLRILSLNDLIKSRGMAMLLEDAGRLDFLVATSGHGKTCFAYRAKSILITSDSPSHSDQLGGIVDSSTSCQVAARDLATGRLLWRRMVCASKASDSSAIITTRQQRHVIVASGDRFYTLDQVGTVRGWIASIGALLWDTSLALSRPTSVPSSNIPRLWLMQNLLVAVLGPTLSILDTRSGKIIGSLDVQDVFTDTVAAHSKWKGKSPPSPESSLHWIQVIESPSLSPGSSTSKITTATIQILMGWLEPISSEPNWSGRSSHAAVLEVQLSPEEGLVASNAAKPLLSSSSSSFVMSSWQMMETTGGAVTHENNISWLPLVSTIPLASSEKPARPLDLSNISKQMKWTTIDHWQSMQPHSNLVRASGLRDDGTRTMALLSKVETSSSQDSSSSFQLVLPNEQNSNEDDHANMLALAHCTAFDNMVIGVQPYDNSATWSALQVVSSSRSGEALSFEMSPIPVEGDVTSMAATNSSWLWSGDSVQDMITLACSAKSMSVLFSTIGGTTRVVTFTKSGKVVQSRIRWTAEEGLASVSSALILDASHILFDGNQMNQKKNENPLLVSSLDLSSRLEFQYQTLMSTITALPLTFLGANQNGRRQYRQQTFGFVKIAVLLSSQAHRMWGMGTTDPHRGELVWTLPLPSEATWHTLVHGKVSSAVAVSGINGGTHSREVLVLSNIPNSMQWQCLDGTTGSVHNRGTVSLSSPVIQIVPLLRPATSAGSSDPACRQMALLLHQDRTVTLVPQVDDSNGVHEIVESNVKQGLFTHVVNRQQSKLESFRIHINDVTGSMEATTVGQTLFPGEDVVGLAYPIRDEIVQSPAMILGDDSLLVKYLNPHMAVLVTFTANNSSIPSLLPNSKKGKGKRKPLGVTPTVGTQQDDTATSSIDQQDPPNLFVNVVDTVSGRVLYRIGHSNAARPQQANIPIVINENWVIYTFVNEKTRRTELGVFSLYEGMIDRSGITAFTSPEQTLAFSSLDARESKPVVLAKSFALTKQVTALGVTVTRAGISTPQILVACGDSKIYAMDRRWLDPRRPVGELKESEKLEGLQQYKELLPLLSLQALSHNQTVEGVTTVISAPTELESQSMILACGGPDIFFAQTSPSRGFDLLPDSFNRILLSLVVLALLIALIVVRAMAHKKIVKESWI